MREEVKWWLSLALKNLERADRALRAHDYAEAIFWCHQAVEFALKACIINRGKLPEKTHNLVKLWRQAEMGIQVELHMLSELTPYYSISRYPDIYQGVPEIREETVRRFYQFTLRLVKRVEKKLHEEGA